MNDKRFIHRAIVVLVSAVALMSCRPEGSDSAALEPGKVVAMRGTLGAGTECPTLTVEGGRMFSLAGDLGRFQAGDQVCVRGTIAEMSICMAGEATISVTSVAAADSCP